MKLIALVLIAIIAIGCGTTPTEELSSAQKPPPPIAEAPKPTAAPPTPLPSTATSSPTSGHPYRRVLDTSVCAGETVTVAINPTGISGFYAVQENFGALTLVPGTHTADSLVTGVFIQLTASTFTYQVLVPSNAVDREEFIITGLIWDDPTNKKSSDTTTLVVMCDKPLK